MDQLLGYAESESDHQKEQIRALLKKNVLKGPPDLGEAHRARHTALRGDVFNTPSVREDELVESRLALLADTMNLVVEEAHCAKVGQMHMRHLLARQQATILEKSLENTDLAQSLCQLTAAHARTSSAATHMAGLTTLGHDERAAIAERTNLLEAMVNLLPAKQKESLQGKTLEELKALKENGVNSRVINSNGSKPYEQYEHTYDKMLVHPSMDNPLGGNSPGTDKAFEHALAKVKDSLMRGSAARAVAGSNLASSLSQDLADIQSTGQGLKGAVNQQVRELRVLAQERAKVGTNLTGAPALKHAVTNAVHQGVYTVLRAIDETVPATEKIYDTACLADVLHKWKDQSCQDQLGLSNIRKDNEVARAETHRLKQEELAVSRRKAQELFDRRTGRHG
jgi:hypothetical protein